MLLPVWCARGCFHNQFHVQEIKDTMLGLVADEELLYAVCPDGFPGEACQAAQRRSRAFAKTPAHHRVNMFWVKQCRVDRLFYPPQKSSLFMPIPHALPLPGFCHVVIVISGFGDGFRRAIVHAVNVMGGTCAAFLLRALPSMCLALRVQFADIC